MGRTRATSPSGEPPIRGPCSSPRSWHSRRRRPEPPRRGCDSSPHTPRPWRWRRRHPPTSSERGEASATTAAQWRCERLRSRSWTTTTVACRTRSRSSSRCRASGHTRLARCWPSRSTGLSPRSTPTSGASWGGRSRATNEPRSRAHSRRPPTGSSRPAAPPRGHTHSWTSAPRSAAHEIRAAAPARYARTAPMPRALTGVARRDLSRHVRNRNGRIGSNRRRAGFAVEFSIDCATRPTDAGSDSAARLASMAWRLSSQPSATSPVTACSRSATPAIGLAFDPLRAAQGGASQSSVDACIACDSSRPPATSTRPSRSSVAVW
jgi:hypothetical protein